VKDSLGRPLPVDARGLLIPDKAAAQEAEACRILATKSRFLDDFFSACLAVSKDPRYAGLMRLVSDKRRPKFEQKPDLPAITRDIARSE
jgi:hypothetical protein